MRACKECRKKIIGRSDKKFCSDSCRNSFNNRRNAVSYNIQRRINGILGKNRRILMSINPSGETLVSRDRLFMEGFNFNYYTNSNIENNGDIAFFCYDQCYIEKGERHVLLKNNSEGEFKFIRSSVC